MSRWSRHRWISHGFFYAHMRPSYGGRHVGGPPSRRRAEFWVGRGPQKKFVKTLSYSVFGHVPLLYHIQALLSRGFEKIFLDFSQNFGPRIKKVSFPASLVYHKTSDLSIGKYRKNKKIFSHKPLDKTRQVCYNKTIKRR